MPLVSIGILKCQYLISNIIPCKINHPVKHKNCLRGKNNVKSNWQIPCESQSPNQGLTLGIFFTRTTSLFMTLVQNALPSKCPVCLKEQSIFYEKLNFLLTDKTLRAPRSAMQWFNNTTYEGILNFYLPGWRKTSEETPWYLSQLHKEWTSSIKCVNWHVLYTVQ